MLGIHHDKVICIHTHIQFIHIISFVFINIRLQVYVGRPITTLYFLEIGFIILTWLGPSDGTYYGRKLCLNGNFG